MLKGNVLNWIKKNPTLLTEIFTKALFDIFTLCLFVLIIVGTITKTEIDVGLIFIISTLGLFHYILAAIIAEKVRFWQLKNIKVVLFRVVVCILATTISISLVLAGRDAVYQLSSLFLMMWIWYRASHYRIEDLPYRETRNYIFSILLIATILSYMPWIAKGPMTMAILSVLYPLLLVIGIIYLGLVNTHNIFMREHENQFNKSKNLRRYRWMSLIFGLLAWLFVQLSSWILVGQSVLKSAINLLADLVVMLFYPLIVLLSKISQLFQSKLAAGGKGEGNLAGEAGDLQKIKQLTNADTADWPWLEPVLLVIVLIIAVYLLYKIFSRLQSSPARHNYEEFEAKEFIFNEAFKWPKRSLKLKFSESNTVRIKYFHWLRYWNNKGLAIGISETPKKFLSRLSSQTKTNDELKSRLEHFSTLTSLYEKVRYGEKTLEGSDLVLFKKIDDKLDK